VALLYVIAFNSLDGLPLLLGSLQAYREVHRRPLERSAMCSSYHGYFVENALQAHGYSELLFLVISPEVDPNLICRPSTGKELTSLLRFDSNGISLVPDHSRIPPFDMGVYSRLLAAHRSLRPKPAASGPRLPWPCLPTRKSLWP